MQMCSSELVLAMQLRCGPVCIDRSDLLYHASAENHICGIHSNWCLVVVVFYRRTGRRVESSVDAVSLFVGFSFHQLLHHNCFLKK